MQQGQHMASSAVVYVRSSRPLDLAIYGVLIVMGTLGVSGLSIPVVRATAIALCIRFGLLNEFGPRVAQTERQPALFFGSQMALVTALLALRSATFDAFTFLFSMLTVQVMLMFPYRIAMLWIIVFYVMSSAILFWIEGTPALFTVLFNAGVYGVCAVFSNTLRETALARRDNEVLLGELRNAQEQKQELAIATERNRLARDLHDSVKQQVFATIMQLGTARVLFDRDPQQARQHVVEAEQLAQQVGTELSLVIHELRPVALGEKGLAEARTVYVADWSRQSGSLLINSAPGSGTSITARWETTHV
jgi:signal transduction histidine kinase